MCAHIHMYVHVSLSTLYHAAKFLRVALLIFIAMNWLKCMYTCMQWDFWGAVKFQENTVL